MDAGGWLRELGQAMRGALARAALGNIAQTLLLVTQAWLLADLLHAALFRHVAFSALALEWALALAIVPARFVIGVYTRRVTYAAALGLASAQRSAQIEIAHKLGPVGLRDVVNGDVLTRIVDGVDALVPYFARYLPQTITAVLVPILLAIIVLPVDWVSALVLVLTAPLIPLFMLLVGNAAARASQQRFSQLQQLGEALMDALAGITTLRQLGAAARMATRLDAVGEAYRRRSMEVLRIAFLSSLVLEFLAMVSIAVVAVLIGFRLLWGELALREGLFVLLLAPEFYLPLRALGSLRHARLDAEAAAAELLALPNAGSPATAPVAGAERRLPATAPSISFEAVRYAYPDRREILSGINLRLQPRRVTALVGSSGGGKSSLMAMLLGFISPQSGRICVDGVDLSTLEMTAWRRQIAWLPQQAHVFEGSVIDNLLIGDTAIDPQRLQQAARASGFDTVLQRLPQAWHTPLGEHGVGLSGGDLQRLQLTRLLLHDDANLWLLDEPTAHLDAVSADKVHAAMRTAAQRRTVLLIAHRLQTAELADEVVVLQQGRIVEQGSPAQLAAIPDGVYARLLAMDRQR